MTEIPERVKRLIQIHEEQLTQEIRELTGRDDITVTYNLDPVEVSPPEQDWPEPAPLPADYWETAE